MSDRRFTLVMNDRRFMLLAAVALLASRVPFLLHNPDWSFTVWEHCFTLSFPTVYADRLALEPNTDIPYWVINQEQMWWHYHAGIGCLAYAVGFLSDLLNTRSLLLVKLIGTAYTLVFVLALAWALRRVHPRSGGWVGSVIPVFLCAFPPVYFLMVTLLPLGHYYETHLFHGIFLPFVVLAVRDRFTTPYALAAGVLGGLATIYTFSNLVFPFVLAAVVAVFATGGWLRRMGGSAVIVAATTAVYTTLGQSHGIIDRIVRATPLAGDELVEPGPSVSFTEWIGSGLAWRAVVEHVDMLLGFHGNGVFNMRTSSLGAVLVLVLVAAALVSATFLLYQVVRSIRPSTRRKMTLLEKFLAAQGALMAAFALAYLVFDPYMLPDDVLNFVGYLLPTFPPLFIGAGAAFAAFLARLRLPWQSWTARAALLLPAAILVAGWAQALATNSRDLRRPEFNSCDSMHTQGYYWEPPPHDGLWEAYRQFANRQGAILDREAGERRCLAAMPDLADRCVFVGYTLEARETRFEMDCMLEPPDRQAMCARAYGAMRWGWDVCWAPDEPPQDLCREFGGTLHEACVGGAYQGTSLDWAVNHCIESYLARCEQTFTSPAAFSACAEQAANLIEGMPPLPSAEGPIPVECEGWPAPWIGLCQRAVAASSRTPGGGEVRACEDLYFERYATELPQHGRLAYDQCLTLALGRYPWCAIGVAREMDDLDCAWAGILGPGDQFP